MPLIVTKGIGSSIASTDLTGVSATYDGNALTVALVLSAPASLVGPSLNPANWVITSPTTSPLTVSGVSISLDGLTITLNVSEAITATYELAVPDGVLQLSDFSGYTVPNPFIFNATGVGPQVLQGISVDARLMDIVFDRVVMVADALIPTNYTATGLTFKSVAKLTDNKYRLTTSRQIPGTVYTVTVSNVRDQAGNLD